MAGASHLHAHAFGLQEQPEHVGLDGVILDHQDRTCQFHGLGP